MTITETKPPHSHSTLIPYLQTGRSGIHINFSPSKDISPSELAGPNLTSTESVEYENPIFPFQTTKNSDPLAHHVKAWLKSDAGSKIANLRVWLQRDRPHPEKVHLPDTTNSDIENLWQEAYGQLLKDKFLNDVFIELKEQRADNGQLLPFRPLLHCRFKKKFFHPPCPLCGGLLELCQNDDLLTSMGLAAYTRSRYRYLFCPTCYQLAGETDFYIDQCPEEQNNRVKTAADLIGDFKNLVVSNTPSKGFPCHNCEETTDCHALDGPVAARIVTIAFYPFHMFTFLTGSEQIESLTFFNMAKGKGHPPPPLNVPEKPKQPPSDESIQRILNRIVSKWQQEVSTKEAQSNTQESPSPKPAVVPPDSVSNQNDNPDFAETLIVQTKQVANRSLSKKPADSQISDRPPGHIKTPLTPEEGLINSTDQEIPETIIVNTKSQNENAIWPPIEKAGTDQQKRPAASGFQSDKSRQNNANMLPETIIIRPGDKRKVQAAPPAPDKAQPIWPETSHSKAMDKPFTFNQARPHHRPNNNPSPSPDENPTKIFTLGHDHEESSPADTVASTPKRSQKPTTGKADEDLAKTIIVNPKSNHKEKD